MQTPWGFPDFDAHEALHFVHDAATGLRAIIAIHSTHLGPAAGGTRFWHYADDADALTDALRLSRGMSFKNAMAGLPLGGGKAVILAPADRSKTPALLAAFGLAINRLGGQYVTAEDVGMSVTDMIEIARKTRFVAGLPVAGGAVGGDPGPHTSLGVFLGIKAAVKRALGKDSVAGLRIALQGAGSVASGVAMHAAAEGATLIIADVDSARAHALATQVSGSVVDPAALLATPADVVSPCALGAILTEQSIAALDTPIVAGGANNQLATRADGDPRPRHPLCPRLCHQRRRDHQRLDRICPRRRCQPGPPADRGDPRTARTDLGRQRLLEPQPGRSRRCHGPVAYRP